MLLPAIWAAHQDRIYTNPPFLLRLDAHEDFVEERSVDYERSKDIKNLEDCLLFANALSSDDGGWVEAVVKMDLVQDVLTLGIEQPETPYRSVTDLKAQTHRIGAVPWDFSSGVSEDVRKLLHDAAGHSGLLKREGPSAPLWVDIDLDFAVCDFRNEHTRIRDRHDLRRWFGTPLAQFGIGSDANVGGLVEHALKNASLVTIATEPSFCGGHSKVAQAIDVLEGQLSGARAVLRIARMER